MVLPSDVGGPKQEEFKVDNTHFQTRFLNEGFLEMLGICVTSHVRTTDG